MAALIRTFDWSSTAIGNPDEWPQTLRTMLRLLLNTRHPMYVWWGPELLCFYNDAYRQSIGPEQHPGSLGRPGQAVWAEIWDIVGPQIDQVMTGGGATWHENALVPITRNGQREDVYWTYSYSPIDDPDAIHGIGGVLVVCTETTQQILNAKKLSDSEERLNVALSAGNGIGTWDWDVPADLVVADRRFAELYGVDPLVARSGAPLGKFFKEILPADLPRVQESIASALRTGDLFHEEYRLRHRDGSVCWVLAEGRAILDEHGAAVRFPGVSFDVTERKQADLRRSALVTLTDRIRDIDDADKLALAAGAILQDVLGASRVSYQTIEDEAEFETIAGAWLAPGTQKLAASFGRKLGELQDELKRGHFIIVTDVDEDPRTIPTAQALRERDCAAFVIAPVLERGRFVVALIVGNAIPRIWAPEDLALIQDFAERTRTATERLRAAAALRTSNETLETRVAERTRQLMAAEEALRQSQKMEALGQLTGGIAHDFNNLLAGISGSLELTERRLSEGRFGDVDRYISTAQESTRRAAALTQRLLAFARRQTLDPRPVDINRMISGMADLLNRSVGPTVRLEIVRQPDLWPTKLDHSQLENALLNLCINARDAMAPDGGVIKIETANLTLDQAAASRRALPAGEYVSLCVADTGAGMAPDVIAKVFDPFFTTKPLGQGTGLGLSMVYGFVRQSGGQVRIDSMVGEGTIMCLYLPRHAGEVEKETPPGDVDIDRGTGETILIIDDEPALRMVIAEVLEESGYRVLQAEDGASGLKLLQSDARIDLLITDVGLPGGLNGRQVADAGRELRPDLRIIFITGFAENAALGNRHLEAGMSIITKPFVMTALANKVREVIDLRP